MEQRHSYARLAVMAVASFVAMYVLMYAMVNSLGNIYNSINQVYMAGLMAAPMVLIELFVMSGMYRNKRLNAVLMVGSVVATAVFFTLIRQQTLVSDRQFLRSMIPHHAGAILMCEEASIRDPRISELCRTIISSQREEIGQMTRLLATE